MLSARKKTFSSQELTIAWSAATSGIRKIDLNVLLQTDILKLCKEIMILINAPEKNLRVTVYLVNGTCKIFQRQIHCFYNSVLAVNRASEEYAYTESPELISRPKSKPKRFRPSLEEFEYGDELLTNISVEDVFSSIASRINVTEITLREPAAVDTLEPELGSIGFGAECLREPEFPLPATLIEEGSPAKRIRLADEETFVRPASITGNLPLEIRPDRRSSLRSRSTETLTHDLTPPRSAFKKSKRTLRMNCLVSIGEARKLYINLNREDVLNNQVEGPNVWRFTDIEDVIDMSEPYTPWLLERVSLYSSNEDLIQRQEQNVSLGTSLEIREATRRAFKTLPPPLLPEYDVSPAKITRIERESQHSAQELRLSFASNGTSQASKDRKTRLLEFITNWNYDEGDLHMDDICGPGATRLEVARIFRDLLVLAKQQAIKLVNKPHTVELDCIRIN